MRKLKEPPEINLETSNVDSLYILQTFLSLLEAQKVLETKCRNGYTLICKCINTPVKRQYINAHFEMAVYHRKRVATIINFLSFISVDTKRFPFNFGKKIFTAFEMTELES